MAIITTWKYDTSGTFLNTIAVGERIWLSANAAARESLEVGQYAIATLVMDDTGTTLTAAANNTRYVSTTEVDLNQAGQVTLNTGNVAQTACTFKISWEDDVISTVLSNCKFYAFDGTDPAVAPDSTIVVAFEHDGAAIRKNQVGGDVAGRAWDGSFGVNTVSQALSVADQVSAANHDFFIGMSAKVTNYGLHTNAKFRISFDVS